MIAATTDNIFEEETVMLAPGDGDDYGDDDEDEGWDDIEDEDSSGKSPNQLQSRRRQ